QEDHERLRELHPPRLEVTDLGERHDALSIVTSPPVSTLAGFSFVPSARNTVPGGIAARTFAPASTRVPFSRTATRSPSRMPSASASPGESSAVWRARANCRIGE